MNEIKLEFEVIVIITQPNIFDIYLKYFSRTLNKEVNIKFTFTFYYVKRVGIDCVANHLYTVINDYTTKKDIINPFTKVDTKNIIKDVLAIQSPEDLKQKRVLELRF